MRIGERSSAEPPSANNGSQTQRMRAGHGKVDESELGGKARHALPRGAQHPVPIGSLIVSPMLHLLRVQLPIQIRSIIFDN